MGPDTEDRIRPIIDAAAAKAAKEAAKEAVQLAYEQFLPVLVQKQRWDDSFLKIVVDTMRYFYSQVELRLLKR